MQNIKHFVVHKIISANLSNCELNVLFMICEFQNINGSVYGVHHRKVADYLGITVQTYYNVIAALEHKKIITINRTPSGDRDITIKDNSFEDGNFRCGYISLRNRIFRSIDFYCLKAKEKMLMIDLYVLLMSKKGKWTIKTELFYERYAQKLKVDKLSVIRYLNTIKNTLSQYIEISRSDGKFFFKAKTKLYQKVKELSDEQKLNEYNIEVCCRRNKIKEYSETEKRETALLMRQYKGYAMASNKNMNELIEECIQISLEYLNRNRSRKEKRIYQLPYKLIHKILRSKLNIK